MPFVVWYAACGYVTVAAAASVAVALLCFVVWGNSSPLTRSPVSR